jgi:hypothetical protein
MKSGTEWANALERQRWDKSGVCIVVVCALIVLMIFLNK